MTDRDLLGDPIGPPEKKHTARTRTRRGDPATSLNAAAWAISRLRQSQQDVYRLFSLYGAAHDEELLERAWREDLAQTESGIRTRRAELVELGFLKDSGRTAETKAGGVSIVWEAEKDMRIPYDRVQRHETLEAAQPVETPKLLAPPAVPVAEQRVTKPTGWWDRELVILDCETTGVDPLTARILQLALVINREGGALVTPDDVVCLIDHGPELEIPADAGAVHGITAERCRTEGRDAVHVLSEAIATLEAWAERGHPLVIFNAGYDRRLFYAECARAGLAVPPIVGEMPVVDPLCLHKALEPTYYGKRQLKVLLARFGVDVETMRAHDAADDARSTGLLLRAMGLRYPQAVHQPLDLLQIYQAEAYRRWRAGSIAYWAKKGQARDVQPVEWLGP